MTHYGSCYCKEIQYVIKLTSQNEARTSICHCKNCKKWTGSSFGVATKIPRNSLTITHGRTVQHISDNGSGTKIYREFCGTCGSGIVEYSENAGEYTYIMYGSLDNPGELPPMGEFFCKYKDEWLPDIPGSFHKQGMKDW